MASFADIIAGLTIIAKYEGVDNHNLGAEHDVIYAGDTEPGDMSEADRAAMEKARWHWDDKAASWRRYV